MNHSLPLLLRPTFLLALLAGAAAAAAPLPATTAVQIRPEADAPVFGYLKAGAEPVPAETVAPDGWMAVAMPGPFEAYVQNDQLTKNLDVRPGATLYLEPKADAPVLTVAVAGDKITITGLRGKWTQVRLDKNVTGFIHAGPLPATAASTGTPPVENVSLAPAPAAPAEGAAPAAGGPGHAVDAGAPVDNSLPRLLEGKLVSSHRFLSPRAPYPWQLDGADGDRIAFVDVSKLLLTEQIDQYVGHEIQLSGVVSAVPDGGDIVIRAESLTLK